MTADQNVKRCLDIASQAVAWALACYRLGDGSDVWKWWMERAARYMEEAIKWKNHAEFLRSRNS